MSGWDWGAFRKYLFNLYLLDGAWTTVWLSVAVMVIGLTLGLGAALMRMSRHRLPRDLSRFYIWLMRGTPLLVQLIIIYTGLPQLGIRLTVIQSALLGLGLNEGAYLAEIIRAGILSVPRGQFDAARAVGMPYWTMLRVVILPQAARVILPPRPARHRPRGTPRGGHRRSRAQRLGQEHVPALSESPRGDRARIDPCVRRARRLPGDAARSRGAARCGGGARPPADRHGLPA